MNQSLYWIGVRESEISFIKNIFKGSITAYGSNKGNNIAFDKAHRYRFDCNLDNDQWFEFVNTSGERIIEEDPECCFMLYYSPDFKFYSPKIRERIIYTNDNEIIFLLESKIRTRIWLSSYVPLPPFYIMEGDKINLDLLEARFPGSDEFVVQADSSCSGKGTWLFNRETKANVLNRLQHTDLYSVSPYLRNSIPVNIHLIIYQEEVILLPPSIQIISNNSIFLSYKGADFISFRQIEYELRCKIEKYAKIIGNKLKNIGYRGVCGIDFILTQADAYFMEINPRFQGSTRFINQSLATASSNLSVQQLHKDSFINKQCSVELPVFHVDLSFYSYSLEKKMISRLKFLHSIQENNEHFVSCIDECLDWNIELHENSHLFELVFNRNIISISPENICIIHSNVDTNSEIIDINNWKTQLLKLKIMLFNHGARMSKRAIEYSLKIGGINHKEFAAVDIILQGIYINVPYGTEMSILSPFEIDFIDGGVYVLNYLDQKISIIEVRSEDPLGRRLNTQGFRFDEIAYLGNDRLRIYHRHSCFYKITGIACQFCDVDTNNKDFTLEDIKHVIDNYTNHEAIQHYLIGGGSNRFGDNFEKILDIVEYIKAKNKKPIGVMSTPPEDLKVLSRLLNAGVTEVAFNLELFDRSLAQKYMPGKGMIPLSMYDLAFKESVHLWGRNKVRTSFVVGLESRESLLRGVEFVCRIGVSPMLSLFKPIKGTLLSHLLPPSNTDVLRICLEVEDLCNKYGITLGPMCKYCEDNVLKLAT